MKAHVLILIVAFAILVSACKKGGNATPHEEQKPGKTLLLFPAQNSVCTPADRYSDAQSRVAFTWAPSADADAYTVNVKNLLTGFSADTTVKAATVIFKLLNSTPYAWNVTAKSTKTTAIVTSDTWKFYVPGPAETYFAPFPVTILSPVFNQNVAAPVVDLSWTGSDPDNDVTTYDVYFGTSVDPAVYKSNIADSFLKSVPITSGTKYYWKVITKDSKGNTSTSGIYQFTVR